MNPRSTSEIRHPSAQTLSLLAGGAEVPEARRHVEAGCVRCTTSLRSCLAEERSTLRARLGDAILGEAPPRAEALAELARRALAYRMLLDAEREAAGALFEALLSLPLSARLEQVRLDPRYGSLGLAEALTAAARSEVFREPARAVELARLAIEVAERLAAAGYPRGLAVDAQALAWAALANAHRVSAELVEAELAMQAAKRCLADGSGHPVERAELQSLEGSLRIDQARFDEAVATLEEAAEFYRRDGNRMLEGKTLLKLGNAAGERGDLERAVSQLERSRALLAGEAAGELRLMAGQALVYWLLESDRTTEVREVFEELLAETEGSEPSRYLRHRLAWAGARIAWREGHFQRAERELVALRETYAERDEVFDQCLVSLDLAGLYLEQGRTGDIRELARALASVFASRRLHHQALAALLLFARAAEAERASASLVREIARYLRRARNNSYLAFEPPS